MFFLSRRGVNFRPAADGRIRARNTQILLSPSSILGQACLPGAPLVGGGRMSRRKAQRAIILPRRVPTRAGFAVSRGLVARSCRAFWSSPRGCGGLRKYRLRTDIGQLDVNTKKNLFGEHRGFGGGAPSSLRKASGIFSWPKSLHGGDRENCRTRPVFPVKERRASREV